MKKKYIVVVLLFVAVILVIANYQTLVSIILPPSPQIVNSEIIPNSKNIFDYSMDVTGTVVNKGGNGIVVVEATVKQRKNSWVKTTQLNLKSSETHDFSISFNEIKLLDVKPTYTIKTYALGGNIFD